MSRTRFASAVVLADGKYKAEALRVGHWDYPEMDKGFDITPAVLKEMAANFNDGAKGFEVLLNREHDDDLACGWVKAVELAPDGNCLYALFEITDEATKKKVDEGTIKYVSSEIDLAWDDPEDKKTKIVFEGMALTNRPYLKRMDPIQPVNLSDFAAQLTDDEKREHKISGTGPEENTPKEAQLITLEELTAENEKLKLELAEKGKGGGSAEAEKLQAQLTEEREKRDKDQKRIELLEKQTVDTNRRLRLTELKSKLSAMIRKGKPITIPMFQKVMKIGEALLADDRVTIQLSSKRKLDEGDSAEETDKLDVLETIIDVLDKLPDDLATEIKDDDIVLDEDAPDKSDDEDEQLDKDAKALMKEDKNLGYGDAVVLAERKRKEGKRK